MLKNVFKLTIVFVFAFTIVTTLDLKSNNNQISFGINQVFAEGDGDGGGDGGGTEYEFCDRYPSHYTCQPEVPQCTNGATNYPYCNNNVCTNGATNYPYCNNQCVPQNAETRNVSCPAGQTGTIIETRNHSCPSNTWSAWTVISNSCTPINYCTPLGNQTQYISCPTGQSGYIFQQRNHSCPSNTWSDWSTISNTCTTINQCIPQGTQTQYVSCPSGQSGYIFQQRSHSCPSNTWSDWSTISNTCTTVNQCIPLGSQTQTISCPSGQTGSITQTRNHSCPSNTWSDWYTTSNNCTTINNYCTNGATNYPYCNNNIINYCTNGATNYPYCNNNIINNYCTNGATNYPYCNNNVNYCSPAQVTTTGATGLTNTATIYGFVNPSNNNATIWFSYGVSPTNLQWQTTRESTRYAGQFSARLSGLNCGTTYFYRAVAQNSCQTNVGQILSFKTANCPVYYPPTPKTPYKPVPKKPVVYTKGNVPLPEIKTKNTECLCDDDYVSLTIENMEVAVVPGKLSNFKVTYTNIGQENLKNLIVRVVLPEQMTIYSVDRGQYTQNGKSVLLALPRLDKDSTGTFIITANTDSKLAMGTQLPINAYLNYTVPTIVKGGVPRKGEVSAYTLTITSNNQQTIANLSGNSSTQDTIQNKMNEAVTSTTTSWFPSNMLEWFISIIAFIAFLLVLRFVINAFSSNKQ